jgi:hypothetical protein
MFKTFPEFSKLTLEDKDEYEGYIKGFPPSSDISFAGLMTWRNTYDQMRVAVLNGNLVVPYWIPGHKEYSGLSLIGTNKVDESLCVMFDYLKAKGEPARLALIPEFVVAHIRYPELFQIKSARSGDEYIFEVVKYYPIKNMSVMRRTLVGRALRKAKDSKITLQSLDLTVRKNQELLLEANTAWQSKNINDFGKLEREALPRCIRNAKEIVMQNVCIYVDEELYGFCLYTISTDGEYATLQAIKATHEKALGFDLILGVLARWFAEIGVRFVNMNSDLGLLRLRAFMLTLGPSNFFRKYTVEPADTRDYLV